MAVKKKDYRRVIYRLLISYKVCKVIKFIKCMKFEKFEEIIAWQKAGALTIEIYKIFKNCNDFGFLNQIRRAVISIMNNISEGYERNTNKEFKNFLYIAKGSSAEVRSMLYVALRLNYITNNEFNKLHDMISEISKLLSGLIKNL